MKKIIYILLPFFLFSCGKLPINGKLDGMWQLMEITHQDGKIEMPLKVYYSIQLKLIRFNRVHEGSLHGSKTDYYIGRFEHTGDSLSFYNIRHLKNENMIATPEELAPFGLDGSTDRFKIEELTNSKMILISAGERLTFRKF